jgi:uncharacterized protein (TIGR00251 family)
MSKRFKQAKNLAKAASKSLKSSKPPQSSTSNVPASIAPYGKDGVKITIHAKPGAKQNSITSITDSEVSVQIAAPPREGEANTELREYFADVLKVSKGRVTLVSGQKSKSKVLVVQDLTSEEVYEKLKNETE